MKSASKMLCEACHRLLRALQAQPVQVPAVQEGSTAESPIRHHEGADDLRMAIENGCVICRRLGIRLEIQGRDELGDDWYTEVLTEWNQTAGLSPSKYICLKFCIRRIDHQDRDDLSHLDTCTKDDNDTTTGGDSDDSVGNRLDISERDGRDAPLLAGEATASGSLADIFGRDRDHETPRLQLRLD